MAYKYRTFKWMSTMDGFNYPVDVYSDTVYLGTIEALPDKFVIRLLDTPRGKITIKQSPNNSFKSQEQAAKVLHRTWQAVRSGGEDEVLKEESMQGKYWWMDPSGNLHRVPPQGHSPFAKYIVSTLLQKTNVDDVYGEMYDAGWLRVAMYGYMGITDIHFHTRKGKRPSSVQRDVLLDLAKENNVDSIIDDSNGGVYETNPWE